MASASYGQYNTELRAWGMVDLVDAEPVRLHLLALSAAGVGYKRVAKVSGVAATSLSKVLYRQTVRVRQRTVDAVLAVTVDALADGALVDATEAWEAVAKLRALGYPKSWIGLHIGQQGRALQLGKKQVTRRNSDALKHLVVLVGSLPYHAVSGTVEDERRQTALDAYRLSRAPQARPVLVVPPGG